MAMARYGRRAPLNYWPGFVDALSTLVIAIVFLLSIFMLAQFFLARELTGRDTALERLNRQIAELTDLLSLERNRSRQTTDQVAELRSSILAGDAQRGRLQAELERGQAAQGQAGQAGAALDAERALSARARATIELLNQQIAAMRRQLAALEDALSASDSRDRESQVRIADLGSRLNVALAQRVQELARYRSDFFGRLRQVLGNRSDLRIVGDRFVLQSEVLFQAGKAELRPEAATELDRIAAVIIEVSRDIPPDIPWILRVDGHTDTRPIQSPAFPSNWSLSAARAIAVVQYLVGKGLPAQRLAATGFGEFQPLELATSDDAYARNRRIELKLTER